MVSRDDKYAVIVSDLPGFQASGRPRAESAGMGKEALAVFISALRDLDDTVPEPRFGQLPDYLRSV